MPARRPKRARQGGRSTPARRPPAQRAARPEPVAAPPEPEKPTPAPKPVVASPVAEPAAAPRRASERLRDTGIPAVLALARRDLAALFLWPPAYAICAVVVVAASVPGYLVPVLGGQPVTMGGVFAWTALATALVIPLVTMRLLAAERRSGALEQLLASPVRLHEVVAARWLAGFAFFLASTAFTLVDVVLLAVYQPGFDAGAVAGGYLGIALIGAAWVAIGLLASSLTESRAIAVVAGAAALVVLLEAGAAASLLQPPFSDLLDYLGAADRALAFEGGQVALRDVVYFLGLTAGALVLTARVLASRRWR